MYTSWPLPCSAWLQTTTICHNYTCYQSYLWWRSVSSGFFFQHAQFTLIIVSIQNDLFSKSNLNQKGLYSGDLSPNSQIIPAGVPEYTTQESFMLFQSLQVLISKSIHKVPRSSLGRQTTVNCVVRRKGASQQSHHRWPEVVLFGCLLKWN